MWPRFSTPVNTKTPLLDISASTIHQSDRKPPSHSQLVETDFGSERSHDIQGRGAESSKDVFHSRNNESAMAEDCSHIVTIEYDEISRKSIREKQLHKRMSLSSKQEATIHQTTKEYSNEILWEDTSNVNMNNSNTSSSRVVTSNNPEGQQAKMHCYSAWDSSKFLLKLPHGDNPASSRNNLQFPTNKSDSSIDVAQAQVQGNQEKNFHPILFGDMFDGRANVEYGSRNFGLETPVDEVSAESFQMNPTKSRHTRNMSDNCEMWRDFHSQEGFHNSVRFQLPPSLSRVSSQSLGSNTSHGSSQFDINDQTSLKSSQVDIQPLTCRGSSQFDLCDGTSGGYDIQYPPSNGTSKVYIQPPSIQYGPNSRFNIQPPSSHGSSQLYPQPQASYGFSHCNLQPPDNLESSQHDNHPPAICGSSQFNIQPPANHGSSQFDIQRPDIFGNSQFNIQSPVSHSSSHFDIQSSASRESNLFDIPIPTNLESSQDNPVFHGSMKSFSDIPFGKSPIKETSVTGQKSGVRSVTFNHVPDFEPDIIGIHQHQPDDSNETPTSRLERETPSRDCDQFTRQSNSYSSTEISSKDHVFKVPQAVPKSVSTPSSSEVYSCNQVDPGTASKLSAFSHRLRALTSATSALVTKTPLKSGGRDNSTNPLVTPRNKTPDSRLVTPRSCTTTTPLGTETNHPDPDCFLSVMEGRGSARCEVGVAAICLSNPTLILCQFSDSSTYPRTLNKLLALNPCEVIFPSTNINPMMSASTGVKLYDDISNSLSLCKVIPIHRKYFNESKGILAIKQIMVPEISSVEMQFHNKFYCLAAANALLKYVEFTHKFTFSRHSLKVDYQVADKSTVIDPATAEHIELMTCLGHRKSKLSLFGVLNHCSTQGGLRLLRSNLFQPPIDLDLIQARQEAIAELIDRTDLYDSLKSTMSRFPDLESVLSLCIRKPELHITLAQVDVKMDQMISLRQIFHLMPSFSSALEKSQQSHLLMSHAAVLKKHLSSSALLLEMLNLVINDNICTRRGSGAAMKFHRAMAIKPDVNGLLDIARRTFSECVDQLEQYVTELGEESALPLKMGWNSQRGFFIQLTSTRTQKFSVKDLPDYFQHIQKQKNQISFVTTEFAVKHQLVKNTLREISTMSNSILDELLSEVREYIGFLHQLSETLCSLDMLLSLASVSMAPDFCKPNFGDLICVRQGRHPILNTMPVEVIPNDIMADPLSRLHVLTGPNMSGKSTYLRQVVLLCIMAQLGCNVPAESATLRIPDRIFSRVSNRDSIETNSSTFMVEMQETSFILTNVGPSSLVIIDELGRGTSAEEGSALCWAVCEKLLQSSCFVLLATHFHQMTGMADFNPCVSNHHFLTETGEDGVVSYSHVLVSGKSPSTELRYGVELAARTLPDTLVARAREILQVIKTRGEARVSGANRLDIVCLQALVEVKRILRLGLHGQQRAEALKQVRQKFIEDAPSSLDEGGYSNEKGVEGEEYREESDGDGSQESGEMEGEESDVEGTRECERVEEDNDTRNMGVENENMEFEDESVNEKKNFRNVNESNSGDLGVGEKNGREEEMGEKRRE